ncbi:hypothetical protein A3K73_01640 [Candidatus Pacearchaeota archaeon RBG_13_36_9]|nr:MAG: hypothetical protein A3K73_01640 [Candidatus Pacearchaeota archaeon RBG_13_36_9]
MEKISLPETMLVFVCGGVAVGKTTLIKSILPRLRDSLYVSLDAVREPMLRTPNRNNPFGPAWYFLDGPMHGLESEHYKKNVGIQSYYAMLELSANNLSAGSCVIIEGNYLSQIKMGYFQDVVIPFLKLKGLAPKMKMLFVYADKETMAKRIKERNAPRDADKLESEEKLWTYLNSQDLVPKELEKIDHIKINGTSKIEDNAKKAINYLLS